MEGADEEPDVVEEDAEDDAEVADEAEMVSDEEGEVQQVLAQSDRSEALRGQEVCAGGRAPPGVMCAMWLQACAAAVCSTPTDAGRGHVPQPCMRSMR